jgi:hypothetical protein
VKPREEYGSLYLYTVRSDDELQFALMAIQKYVNDSYLEFTSGVTIDQSGNHIMSSISVRKSPKSGQRYKAVVYSFDEVLKSTEIVSKKLGAVISFQIKMA